VIIKGRSQLTTKNEKARLGERRKARQAERDDTVERHESLARWSIDGKGGYELNFFPSQPIYLYMNL
jgi:hypothetical protein